MRRFIVTLLAGVATTMCIVAQQLTWSVDFNTFFDNREGDDLYTPAETIFKTRLAPEIGIAFLDGMHRISGGVSWIQPVGNEWKDYKICPTLYYRYQSPTWRFTFGMLPRTLLIDHLPNALWSDKIAYNEPNIRGVLVQYVRRQGYAEFFLDWRSLQSENRREAFNVNFNGMWSPRNGMLMLGGHAMLNHFAKQKNPPEGQGIVDNIIMNPLVGVNLTKHTPLDSFTIKGGLLAGIYRDRGGDDKWTSKCGANVELVAEWKFLGLKNTLYAGKSLFQLYGKYGEPLDMGEPYYQANWYNRTNVYAYIFRNPFVNLEASLNFHLTKDAFGFQQQLLLRVYIDNYLWKSKGKKTSLQNLDNIF